uniref:Uncharacterized protein n=1 Tax=Physcomitrium patens TaxID=3218 RepID=A0A2K1JZ52_PHYPA|nr:hypothetical protein PHYPA_013928 [Physcomitrium patens]
MAMGGPTRLTPPPYKHYCEAGQCFVRGRACHTMMPLWLVKCLYPLGGDSHRCEPFQQPRFLSNLVPFICETGPRCEQPTKACLATKVCNHLDEGWRVASCSSQLQDQSLKRDGKLSTRQNRRLLKVLLEDGEDACCMHNLPNPL